MYNILKPFTMERNRKEQSHLRKTLTKNFGLVISRFSNFGSKRRFLTASRNK